MRTINIQISFQRREEIRDRLRRNRVLIIVRVAGTKLTTPSRRKRRATAAGDVRRRETRPMNPDRPSVRREPADSFRTPVPLLRRAVDLSAATTTTSLRSRFD